MNLTENNFIATLISIDPTAIQLHAEHLSDNGEALNHVFFGDWTRSIEQRYRVDRNYKLSGSIAEFIEAAVSSQDEVVKNVIHLSFFENIVGEKDIRERLLSNLLPRSRSELERWIASHG